MPRARFFVALVAIPLLARAGAACRGSVGGDVAGSNADASANAEGGGPGDSEIGDAGTVETDVVPTDAGADHESRCDPNKPFGDAVNVPNVNSPQDESRVTLTADELTMILSSSRGDGGFDLYVATRTDATSTFGDPQRMDDVSDPVARDRAPTISSDGNRLYFYRTTICDTCGGKVWTTERSASGTFATPALATGLEKAVFDPYLQADGKHLYFVGDGRVENETWIFWEAAISGGTPTSVSVVPFSGVTPQQGSAPVMSADGLTFYFAKQALVGSEDFWRIWRAKRAASTGAFGTPELVTELNTVGTVNNDLPSWLSPDGCRMYLISDRPNGVGSLDVWMASRPK